MKFVLYLVKRNKIYVLAAILMGALSGAANVKMISLIGTAIGKLAEGEPQPYGLVVIVLLTAIFSAFISQAIMIQLALKLGYDLNLDMSRQVLEMPIQLQEKVGDAKLLAAFTQDINAITAMVTTIPNLLVNILITVGCLVYLGTLSPLIFGILLGCLVTAVVSYLIPERFAINFMRQNREAWDKMVALYKDMIEGSKELKLHYGRRMDFYENHLQEGVETLRSTAFKQRMMYNFLGQWLNILFFVFLVLLLFVLPGYYHQIPLETLTTFAILSFYVRGPLGVIITSVQSFRRADIAYQKIRDNHMQFQLEKSAPLTRNKQEVLQKMANQAPFKSIELHGVTHRYHREKEDHTFLLGPMDLTVHAGALIFITGGNGSGKTTLAKLITGLYKPESGAIRLNGEIVEEENMECYRQYFSAIFSDFFVFEQFLGMEKDRLDERATHFLEKLHLAKKATVTEGKLSTKKLSSGQTKRLALVTAFLEDKPVYLFDEWAADQDPEFKDVFYHEFLPELKAQGKTLLVISHDDRYFHLADRTLKLTDGQLKTHTEVTATE